MPGSVPTDFLAHWLGELGHPFLGLSYPLEHRAFQDPDPALTVAGWADQVAEATAACLRNEKLELRTAVLAWSMSGRLVYRLRRAFERNGIELVIFIGLDAALGVAQLGDPFETFLVPDESSGMASVTPLLPFFHQALDVQRQLSSTTLTNDDYDAHYVGNFPINLAATTQRALEPADVGASAFPLRPDRDAEDIGASQPSSLPPVAAIASCHTGGVAHALINPLDWGALATRSMVEATVLAGGGVTSLATLAMLREHLAKLPARLSRQVAGSHLFFVGERGASTTARLVHALVEDAQEIAAELRRISDDAL